MVDPRNGKRHPQFTVNPKHEKSFKHKDSFKKRGARWFNGGWTFTAFDDDFKKILKNKIKPTLEEIVQMDGEDPMQIPAILNFLESEMEKILSGEKEETKVNTKTRNDEKISHLSKKAQRK